MQRQRILNAVQNHLMNHMVSMVGPIMMSHGSGSQTGKGIQEGMAVVRQGHALSEDLGPGFGRGMGMTTQEKNLRALPEDKYNEIMAMMVLVEPETFAARLEAAGFTDVSVETAKQAFRFRARRP